MKSTFGGFYSINENILRNIWLDESTMFVFDTNCLLNLYRCEEQTRDDIISVMREISNRTWIPFQVGFEYQRNRRKVIEESIKSLDKIKSELEKIYNQNILSSSGIQKHLYTSLSDEINELQEEIKNPIKKYIEQKIEPRIQSKKKISTHDSIRDQIDSIILDKVGVIPSQERINAINEEGLKRYAIKQPPGFMDEANKKDLSYFSNVEFQDKFGDLYLWKEIIEKAKSDNIKNVIFICDDSKKDWWFIHSGKTHGVLESLKTEICKESNIQNFKAISQLTFLHEAKSYLQNIDIKDSSLKEVEELTYIDNNDIIMDFSNKGFENDDNKDESLEKFMQISIRNNKKKADISTSKFFHEKALKRLINRSVINLSEAKELATEANVISMHLIKNREKMMSFLPESHCNLLHREITSKILNVYTHMDKIESLLKDKSMHSPTQVSELYEENEKLDLVNEALAEDVSLLKNLINDLDLD